MKFENTQSDLTFMFLAKFHYNLIHKNRDISRKSRTYTQTDSQRVEGVIVTQTKTMNVKCTNVKLQLTSKKIANSKVYFKLDITKNLNSSFVSFFCKIQYHIPYFTIRNVLFYQCYRCSSYKLSFHTQKHVQPQAISV